MFGTLAPALLLLAAFNISWPLAAVGGTIHSLGSHRDDVDVSRYPWSSIGKLTNETGASCSGAVIASDKILTAAHCLFNPRTRRFIPAAALHFLVGYRTGRYSAHVRVSSYVIGAGFDPLRYGQTSNADWAVLTVTERLPREIEPIKLSSDIAPSGTKAVMAGYPRDRVHAMTADSDCELREKIDGGRLFLHTCRGIGGYSGAPILVRAAGDEVRIAGIQIAMFQSGGTPKMLAVPAPVIALQSFGGKVLDDPMWGPPDAILQALLDAPVTAVREAPTRMEHVRLVGDAGDFDWETYRAPESVVPPARDVRVAAALPNEGW